MPRSRSATVRTVRPSPERLGDRLFAEWDRLRRDPDAVGHAAGWHLTGTPPGDLDDVLAAAGFGAVATPATEAAFRRLLAIAADDALAGRVALQRLLPGLLARARRHAAGAPQAFEELVGAAWIAIATFDPRRRPSCLAAALVGDAEHRAFRAPLRRRRLAEVATELDFDAVAAADTHDDALQELAQVFRIARLGGVADDDIDLLRRLIVAERAEDVAIELNVTSRTVRNRRARITQRLRELAA
jgi:hypothetical protein